MARCPYEKIADLEPVFEAMREWPGVKEKSPGVFYVKSTPFLHFHLKDDDRWADVRKGKTWGDRLPIRPSAKKTEVSRFLAEVRRRYEATAMKKTQGTKGRT